MAQRCGGRGCRGRTLSELAPQGSKSTPPVFAKDHLMIMDNIQLIYVGFNKGFSPTKVGAIQYYVDKAECNNKNCDQ